MRRVALVVSLFTVLAVGLGVGGFVNDRVARGPGEASLEVGFARDMATHHAQAVDMAMTLLTRTADADLRVVATDIVLTQQAQIGQMRGWLDVWGRPASTTRAPMGWMGHSGPMSGMASQAEVNELRTAPVAAAEVSFVRLMIVHHQGGIAMAEAASKSKREVVRTLAERIAAAQRSELRSLEAIQVRLASR